jgi:hypothetical protein
MNYIHAFLSTLPLIVIWVILMAQHKQIREQRTQLLKLANFVERLTDKVSEQLSKAK